MPKISSKKARPKPRGPHGSNKHPAVGGNRSHRTRRASIPAGGAAGCQAKDVAGLNVLFPGLSAPAKRFGVAVLLAMAERRGDDGEVQFVRQEALFARPGARPKTTMLDRAGPEALARLLSGLAHPDRIRLARSIVAGANTHHLLSEAVKLKAGPLYHHLRELERAGLLSMVERNVYELTALGRFAIFVTAALGTAAGGNALPSRKPIRFAVNAGDSAGKKVVASRGRAK